MPDITARLSAALGERYALGREIGRGGMAVVYLARDRKHDRAVAIKVLRPDLAALMGAERFLQEIQIAARLSHPHILPLHDSGQADGLLYYVMPYVEGESLRTRMERERQLDVDEAVRIAREVADALAYAHSHGIIHRDIKPENVLLSGGHAVVADFGIARAIDSAAGSRLTETGLSLGTPAYMSPEQAAGDTHLDGRSDEYALACMLYEMLDGTPPHAAATPAAMLARRLTEPPPSLTAVRSRVTPALDAAVRRALAPAPADRYATTAGFADALAASEQGAPEAVRRKPILSGRRITFAVGAVATAALLAVALHRWHLAGAVGPTGTELAVFPFRPADASADAWREQLPDLVASFVDGTPGIRVADPWSLWRPLRPTRTAPAASPGDAIEAARFAQAAHASHFVLGAVTRDSNRVTVTIRIYETDSAGPPRSLVLQESADSLRRLAERVAIGIIGVVEPDAGASTTVGEGYGTASVDALKDYLRARENMRRGAVDSAESAIDAAVRADSDFAPALLEAAEVKSWAQNLRGEQYHDILPLALRAAKDSARLSPRNRLRVDGLLASVRTDGAAAARAAEHILQMDSTDLGAWTALATAHVVYGWEYGATPVDARHAVERALALDSTNATALAVGARLALATGDPDAIHEQLRRLESADTTNALTRLTLLGLHAVLVPDSLLGAFADRVARAPIGNLVAALRALWVARPERVGPLLDLVRRALPKGQPAYVVLIEKLRFMLAAGRAQSLDSAIAAGALPTGFPLREGQMLLVTAAMAGVGDSAAAVRAVRSLTAYVPFDSALAYFNTRPVWLTLWIVGAHDAMFGDTTAARRAVHAIGRLPAGGSPDRYREALQADIDARLAARSGRLAVALPLAQRAYADWSIHTDAASELMPEPNIRFHLAMLLRAAGKTDSAAALLRSLLPPTNWFGFLTPRASYELGVLAERRGDYREARTRYLEALAYWRLGGPDAAAVAWRDQAEAALRRVIAEQPTS